ncbi:hypothetical protein H2136_22190 [Aeromonas hydrophila]|uniref:Uncharacterized protein n=1 Tax=Aeromonas hydrophila TaxID=644 RepID=A0A926IYI1_AERHY|nr:hypothetical protein [Aeromonas hydrophila]
MDEEYLTYRISQVAYLGERLAEAGIPIQTPPAAMRSLSMPRSCYPIFRPSSSRPMRSPASSIWKGACAGGDRLPAAGARSCYRQAGGGGLRAVASDHSAEGLHRDHMDYVADCLIAVKARASDSRAHLRLRAAAAASLHRAAQAGLIASTLAS